MANPLREITLSNSAGSYHVRNLFDADRKGFDIPDDDYLIYLNMTIMGYVQF